MLVKGRQRLNGLDFHYNCALYQQVDPVATLYMDSFVENGKLNLAQNFESTAGQFVGQSKFRMSIRASQAQVRCALVSPLR